LRGKGLPTLNGYGKGDIVVNISVYIPEVLSKEEKKTIESFRESDNFRPTESVKEKIFRRFKSFFD
jgi:molecular chaperone DnaJ